MAPSTFHRNHDLGATKVASVETIPRAALAQSQTQVPGSHAVSLVQKLQGKVSRQRVAGIFSLTVVLTRSPKPLRSMTQDHLMALVTLV